MATAVQVESLWSGLTDNNGEPLGGGKVYTYNAGTTTPVSLFTASDKSTSATNPLILDAYGKAQVWADGRYKFVIKTSADVTLYTFDNLLYGFDDTTVLYGATSTGSANAQTVDVPATVTSYANGQTVSFVAGYTNTGATTLQFNSLSAVNLVKGPTPSSLEAGDLIAGQLYTATYHGGSFRLLDYPSVADVQRSRFQVASSVAGTNTITANLTPALSSYETGTLVRLVAVNANTGAATLNLNGLGAKTIQRQGTALVGGEFKAGDVLELFYDGTQFQLINVPSAPLFVDRTNNRVGIGTATPSVLLDVQEAGYPTQYIHGFVADGGAPGLVFRKSRGATIGTHTIVQNGDGLGTISFQGANGSTYTTGAVITASVSGTPGASNDMPTALRFLTTPDGSGTPVEAFRVEPNGSMNVGITGFTSTKLGVYGADSGTSNYTVIFRNSAATTLFAIRNDGQMNVGVGAASPYNNTTGSAANAFLGSGGDLQRSTSSLRYKSDVTNATFGLAEVMQLRPVTYKGINDGDKIFAGLIAEEVDAIGLTSFVQYDDQGQPDALAYGNMVSLAFAAIQELDQKVQALEARIAALES